MSDPFTGAHPDVETLSDLEAGLADPAAAVELRAHLASCVACAGLVALLRDAQAMLAGLPAVPMPADVATRIDAALAGAATNAPSTAPGAPGAAGTAGAAAAPAGVTVLAEHADRRRRRAGRRWLPGAGVVAAGVAVLFAGAVGLGALQSQPAGKDKATTSAAAGDASTPRPLTARASGQDYTPATLNGAVRGLLASQQRQSLGVGPPGSAPSPSVAADGSSALSAPAFAPLQRPAALAACVAELAGNPTQRPLAVDFATFGGKPAVVVVLPDRDPAKVDAWVVGPGCAPGHSEVLRFQVVPRVG